MTLNSTTTTVPSTVQLGLEAPVAAPSADPVSLTFIILFALSELIGMSKLKSNSVVQVLVNLLRPAKFFRKEDDLIVGIREDLEDLTRQIKELKKAVKPETSAPKSSTRTTK